MIPWPQSLSSCVRCGHKAAWSAPACPHLRHHLHHHRRSLPPSPLITTAPPLTPTTLTTPTKTRLRLSPPPPPSPYTIITCFRLSPPSPLSLVPPPPPRLSVQWRHCCSATADRRSKRQSSHGVEKEEEKHVDMDWIHLGIEWSFLFHRHTTRRTTTDALFFASFCIIMTCLLLPSK